MTDSTLPQDTQAHGECDAGQKRVDETNTSAKHVRISDKNEHIPQSRTVQEQALIALTQEAQGRGEHDDPAKPCPRCGSVREQEPIGYLLDDIELARAKRGDAAMVFDTGKHPVYLAPSNTQIIRQNALSDCRRHVASLSIYDKDRNTISANEAFSLADAKIKALIDGELK